MAKNNEFTDLIQEYLTDGNISEKERKVLLKKAEKLGIDVDEADLYIDAQQQKEDQKNDSVANRRLGKTCPFCGAPVQMLTDECPHCGEDIIPEASEELDRLLEKLEDALVFFKTGGKEAKKNEALVERYVREAKLYYGANPIVRKLLDDISYEKKIKETKIEQKEKEYEKDQYSLSFEIVAHLILLVSFLCLVLRCTS